MTIFSLTAQNATLHTSIMSDGFPTLDRWSLSLDCVLGDRDSLEMSDGVREHDIAFAVNLRSERDLDWLRRKEGFGEAAGALHYFEPKGDDGARVFFEAYVPADELRELLAFARHGRFPSKFSFGVHGAAITYGWAPDGSMKKWDAAVKLVPITNVSFSLPLVPSEEEGEKVEVYDSQRREPQTPVGADLLPELRRVAERQLWVVYALCALAGVLLFRR